MNFDVIEMLENNKISGSFSKLSSEGLRDIFPIVGDRIAVKKLQEKVRGPLKVDSVATSSKSIISLPNFKFCHK